MFEMLNLDARRDERADARRKDAGARAGRGDTQPIRLGGNVIAVLGAELPLNALAPLEAINEEIALLVGQAMRIAQTRGDSDSAMGATQVIIDLLASTPNLPAKFVEVLRGVARNLLDQPAPDGTPQHGYDAFIAANPTLQDCAALGVGIFSWYGLSLGESQPSSDLPVSAGRTSGATSKRTTRSTSAARGHNRATPGSSTSAA